MRTAASSSSTSVTSLLPSGLLDRFKLAGVIAAWWNEALPDFKTLLENGFPGVIDGWIDAIADALEDDDAAGPAFDPFGHKLVIRMMGDYLKEIDRAKNEIAKLKGEKEAFEMQNRPEDDEEENSDWNYAKELERRIRELKEPIKEELKRLKKLENGLKKKPNKSMTEEIDTLRTAIAPVLQEILEVEAELVPYEKIKEQIAAARVHYRALINMFLDELKLRCDRMNEEQKCNLVLELLALDLRSGLDAAVAIRRHNLVRFLENLWGKYRSDFEDMRNERYEVEIRLVNYLKKLAYL